MKVTDTDADDFTVVDGCDWSAAADTPPVVVLKCGCGKVLYLQGPDGLAGMPVSDWPCSGSESGLWSYCRTTERIVYYVRKL